ncbi:MAG TPA: diacylglycerol kinase family protein [Ktedonobacterales bacterium]|nr:diacylglycerol kinase family protein [Ktedonobacterales bacterium]
MDGRPQTSSTPSSPQPSKSWQASWRPIVDGWHSLQDSLRNSPRIRTFTSISMASLRIIEWRERLRRPLALTTPTLRRMSTAARLAYYVLPAPTRRKRGQSDEDDANSRLRGRIIANPRAGTLRLPLGLNQLYQVAAALTEAGLPVEVCLTERPGHARQLAREAVRQGMEMVVAAGGDGTVNEILQELAGHSTALGVLPLGTVNVWARETGIPLSMPDAARVLLYGVRRRVDLGRAGNHYFLMMAGIGFDAEVARRVEQSLLEHIGLKMLDYLTTAGVLSVTQKPVRVRIRRDGKAREISALMLIIGNTRLYGGALTFTRHAVADDGLLDIVTVGGGGLMYRLGVLRNALLRRPRSGPRVRYQRARSIRIEADTPLPVQVDGEVLGTLPMSFSIAPLALTVIVPPDAPDALFSLPPLA